MRKIARGEIERISRRFLRLDDDLPISRRRERSWDFCYDYFHSTDSPTDAMELSSLHLGYYLASWGMMRGSSFLFNNTNLCHYRKTIEIIEELNEMMRGWDVHEYLDDGRYEQYEEAWSRLKSSLLPEGGASLILISKVMMGVWGCVPSFDTYFTATMRWLSETPAERASWRKANRQGLSSLHEIYLEHADEVENVRAANAVWSFALGGPGQHAMPRAKVLDIYGFRRAYEGL